MKLTRTSHIGVFIAGGIIILIVLAVIFGLTIKQNKMIRDYLHLSARAYAESIVLVRQWNANYGGVYVLKKEGMKSNPYLEDPDITAINGHVYTMKNPALMTREISMLAKQAKTYQYHITSLNLLNPNNVPDSWERKSLKTFEEGIKEITQVTELDGKSVYRLMRPLLYKKGCVACHAKQGYRLGDIRGGISVTLPYDKIEMALKGNQRRMSFLAVIIVIALGGTFYLLVWQLMRRLSKAVDQLDKEKSKIEAIRTEVVVERNKLDDIVSNIDADLFLLDRDMKILWVNKKLKERAGYTHDVIGRRCYVDYLNAEIFFEECPAALVFRSGTVVRKENMITHGDGTTRYYSFTCSPVKDSNNKVTHVLELVQDITDKKKQEDELEKKIEQLDQMQQKLLKVNLDFQEKNKELERFNKLFIDRELRIKELKEEITKLKKGKVSHDKI
ncbi:MAG: DUF3365 domain-containing protein [Desulfobacterales bacterium]